VFPLSAICPAHLTLLYLATLIVSGEEINSSFRFAFFCIIRNNCSLSKPNTEEPPLVGCAHLFNRHTHSHLPYPKPVSLSNPKICHAILTEEAPNMNGVTTVVLHIRVYFRSKVNSNIRPNCFTVNRIDVRSDRRDGTKFVCIVKQSGNL